MNNLKMQNKKIGINILIWLVIIFIFISLNQWSRNFQLQNELNKIRKESKNDIEEQIRLREILIKKLENQNKFHKKEIDNLNYKIDSLEKIKSKVKIKYVNKIEYIKNMDSEKIKKYWYEEFN
jgi:uncharacterized protein YlxW (UPF0749 family)